MFWATEKCAVFRRCCRTTIFDGGFRYQFLFDKYVNLVVFNSRDH
jgi:hypothetical protein